MSSVLADKPSVLSRVRRALGTLSSVFGDGVREPVQVAALLTRVSLEAPMVSVNVRHSKQTYASAVLEVSHRAERIWLDELAGAGVAARPQVGSSLEVSAQLEGASIRFCAPIAEIAERNGIPCFGLSRPRRVRYRQRRTHHRFSVSDRTRVYLVDSNARLQQAVLHDISLGGMAAHVSAKSCLTLTRGDRLGGCTIKLLRQALQCNLEVRHVQHDEGAGYWMFGARFVDLAGRNRTVINNYLTTAA